MIWIDSKGKLLDWKLLKVIVIDLFIDERQCYLVIGFVIYMYMYLESNYILNNFRNYYKKYNKVIYNNI